MSNTIISGGFPHLYRTDISGAPIDASAVRSVARCDVAELQAEITPSVAKEQEHHLINIAAKRALTVTEFKQMFYARGDDKFSLANVYECPNLQSNILASVWGKHQGRKEDLIYPIVALAPPWQDTLRIYDPNIINRFAVAPTTLKPTDNDYFLVTDVYGISIKFMFVQTSTGMNILNSNNNVVGLLTRAYSSSNSPAVIKVFSEQNIEITMKNLVTCVQWAGAGNVGTAWAMGAHLITKIPIYMIDIVFTATENFNSINQGVVPFGDFTTKPPFGGSQQIVIVDMVLNQNTTPQVFDTPMYNEDGEIIVSYNTSRVINYNRLGGRPNDPSGVDLAYGYATDLQRNFYAQFEVMGNLERDLCVKRDDWTLCSRLNIEDQLYGLSFVAETCEDVCMKVTCSRKWSEVEDALAESCIAENNTIGWGDYVDLYINVRVTNANPRTLDTLLRIRYPVQITRGPDDLGNWNVVASDAADAVITTGVGYDGPEGGNLQYRNAAQTEIHPDYMNQQQTQRWDSTRVHNTNQKVDPHDVVGNP